MPGPSRPSSGTEEDPAWFEPATRPTCYRSVTVRDCESGFVIRKSALRTGSVYSLVRRHLAPSGLFVLVSDNDRSPADSAG